MKFRRKPVVIEAYQWFKNGDHPEDGTGGEGRLVRYFRDPDQFHGWIDTLEGGHRVCPGDWIIRGIQGEYYPCKPDIFEETYEPVEAQE